MGRTKISNFYLRVRLDRVGMSSGARQGVVVAAHKQQRAVDSRQRGRKCSGNIAIAFFFFTEKGMNLSRGFLHFNDMWGPCIHNSL